MSPEEIQALKTELKCSTSELAQSLDVDVAVVAAWEAGELFPTKRFVQALGALQKQGPSAITRAKPKRKAKALSGNERMATPEFWQLVRKLLAHPELFEKSLALAEKYADPLVP